MKRLQILMLAALAVSIQSAEAVVNCGSKNAGFKISGSTGSFVVGSNGMSLSDGTIRSVSTAGTPVSGTVTCSNAKIEIDDVASDQTVEMTADGSYNLSTGVVTLGNDETLRLESGKTLGAVTVNGGAEGTPSVIEGVGALGGAITVNSSKYLDIDLQSILNQSITNNGTVKLLDDLKFEDGKEISGGTVNCNGYRVIFGGSNSGGLDNMAFSGTTFQDAHIEFNSKVTLMGNLTMNSSAGSINANSNVIDFNGSSINMGSQDLTIVDATLAKMTVGSLTNSASNDLYLSNVIISHATSGQGVIRINGAGAAGAGSDALAKMTLAANSSFFTQNTVTFDNEVSIDLLKPCNLDTTWDFDSTAYINGNSYTLDLAAGTLNLGGSTNAVYLSDLTLINLASGSLANPGDIYASNLTVRESAGEVLFRGAETADQAGFAQISVTDGNFFSSAVTFNNDLTIDFLKPTTLTDTWTFAGTSYLNGQGQTLNLASGVLALGSQNVYFSDIKLAGMVAGSMSGFGDVFLNDVTVQGANGEVTVSGNSTNNNSYAQVSLTDASFFDNDVTFDNGAKIELLNDTTIATGKTWTFSADSVIEGHGNILDISNGRISIAADTTLYLKDVILKGLDGNTTTAANGSITCANATTSILSLSETTIKLAGDVTLNKGKFTVTGPSTLVTGSNTFTTASGGVLTVDGVTLWYDTLSSIANNNVTPSNDNNSEVEFLNGGTIKTVETGVTSLSYPRQSRPLLSKSVDLYQSSAYSESGVDTTSVDGVTMTFQTGDGTITNYTTNDYVFDGNGRTVRCANAESTATLVTLEANVDVTTKNVTFDGLKSGNITLGGDGATAANLVFGANTTIRLQDNDTLDKDWVFGVAPSATFTDQSTAQTAINAATSAQMVLDLNGHTLDMGSNQIVLNIGTLTIKNGRVTGLNSTGSKMFTGGQGQTPATTGHEAATFKFEDVELVMEGDCTFLATGGEIEFTGMNKLTGLSGATFHYDTTGSSTTLGSEQAITVNVDSELLVDTGLIFKVTALVNGDEDATTDTQLQHLKLNDGSTTNGHGTLKLYGGRLTAAGSGELLVNKGRLIADHRASLDGGSNGIRIGSSSLTETDGYNDPGDNTNDLTIELEPGTLINVVAGTVTYDNFETA